MTTPAIGRGHSIQLPPDPRIIKPYKPSSGTPKEPKSAHPAVKEAINLLRSGHYSDLTLVLGDQQFKAHRFILCSRSPVFRAACDGDFCEAKTGLIEIGAPCATIASVQKFLECLYSYEYKDWDDFDPRQRCLNNLDVYLVAQYYDASQVVECAAEKVKRSMATVPADSLGDIIQKIYEYTPTVDNLRVVIALHCVRNLRNSIDKPEFLSQAAHVSDFMSVLVTLLCADQKKGETSSILAQHGKLMDHRHCRLGLFDTSRDTIQLKVLKSRENLGPSVTGQSNQVAASPNVQQSSRTLPSLGGGASSTSSGRNLMSDTMDETYVARRSVARDSSSGHESGYEIVCSICGKIVSKT